MSVRTPFQIFKSQHPEGTIAQFNALPLTEALTFKITASSEKLRTLVNVGKSQPSAPGSEAITWSTSSRASLAKAAGDLLQQMLQYSQDKDRTSSLFFTDAFTVLSEVCVIVLPDSEPITEFAQEPLATLQKKLSDAEIALKKSARSELAAEEPLRKSARIQSQREAQEAAAKAVIAVDEAEASAKKPRSKDSKGSDVVVVVPSRSRPSDEATTKDDLVHVIHVLPELSNGIAPLSAMDLTSEDPAPRSPETDDVSVVREVIPVASQAADVTQPLSEPKAVAPKKPRAPPNASAAKPPRGTQTHGALAKRPPLTNAEKKVVRMLQELLQTLAVAYANKELNMLPLFAQLRTSAGAIQQIIDSETSAVLLQPDRDITKPIPFPGISMKLFLQAIDVSQKAFEKNEEDCQTEFDEYLIHRMAHAAVVAQNMLEGYESLPERLQSQKDLEARRAGIAAEKARREEAIVKMQEKARAKEEALQKRVREREEEAARKENERNALRSLGKSVDEDLLREDTELVHVESLGYVSYAPLPLPLDEYEQALQLWAMIVSVPRALLLSQFSFALFLTALKEHKSENGLMQEVFKALTDVNVKHFTTVVAPSSSSGTPRLNIRGKDWFSAAVEFVNVALGTKKQRPMAKKKKVESEDEEDESDDDETTSSSSSSSDESSSDESGEDENENDSVKEPSAETVVTAGGEGAAVDTKEEQEDVDPLATRYERELKETLEKLVELRSYASWGNIEVVDRLRLLRYLVNYAMETDAVRDEGETIFNAVAEETAQYERKLTEARSEAEKELRALAKEEALSKKPVAVGAETPKTVDFAKKKAAIMSKMESLIREARISKFTRADQEDRGARIMPLGRDRYHRLYWRMPLDRSILVETVEGVTNKNFPIIDTPPTLPSTTEGSAASGVGIAGRRRGLLIDEEIPDVPQRKRGRDSDTPAGSSTTTPVAPDLPEQPQRVWGIIKPEYLPSFVASLAPNGRREGLLKEALEPLQDYLKHLESPHEGMRMTRSRAAAHGYLNKLRAF